MIYYIQLDQSELRIQFVHFGVPDSNFFALIKE